MSPSYAHHARRHPRCGGILEQGTPMHRAEDDARQVNHKIAGLPGPPPR